MKFKKKTLKNGLRIITAPMKDTPTATVMVYVETGSDYEDEKNNGIAHFLEHMLFKGTEKRTCEELNIELDSAGAASNAFTSNEYTGYFTKAHHKKLPKLIDVVSDIYLNSTLPDEDIEKERGVIIEEINMYEDKPNRKVWDLLCGLMYGDQPAGRSVAGPISNIKRFGRKDFIDYRKAHYVAEATTVIVAGNINEKEVFKLVEEKFSNISIAKKEKRSKTKESQRGPEIETLYKKTDQSHILFGFRAMPISHKDQAAVSVLGTILGGGMSSRLFRDMRDERGLCYYIYSYADLYTDRGVFLIGSGVNNKKLDESIDAILNQCKRITEETVPEKELKKAKDYLIGNFSMDLEGSDDVGGFIATQELLLGKVKKPQEVFKEIRSVSTEDVQRVAKKIFNLKGANLAIVGPIKESKKLEKHWSILARRK